MGLRNWDETNKNDFMGKTNEAFLMNRSDEDLVDIIMAVLETDINLDFLLELKTKQLEILAACIRDRLGRTQINALGL